MSDRALRRRTCMYNELLQLTGCRRPHRFCTLANKVGNVDRDHVWSCPSTNTPKLPLPLHQTWNWIVGSPGQWIIWSSFTSGSPGHHFDPVWDPSFSGSRKKCPKCKTYICNAEMTKVIVRCLLFHWNHWISVHAMNFYFYLWLLKILWPENTSSHINRHLVFIIEQGHRVNWVSGSLDSRNSQIHKMWPSSISALHGYIGPASPLFIQHLDWVNRFCKATDR